MAVNYKSLAKTGLYSKQKIADTKKKVDTAMASKPPVSSASSASVVAQPATAKSAPQQVVAKPIAPVRKTTNPALASAIGSGTNFGLGTPQSLEFSVLPGAKSGPVSIGYANQMPGLESKTSTFSGARTMEDYKRLEKEGAIGRTLMDVGALGATLATPLPGDELIVGSRLVSKIAKPFQKLFRGGKVATKADDVEKISRPARIPPSITNVGKAVGPVASTVLRTVAKRPVLSALGAIAVGTGAFLSNTPEGSSQAGQVRNAVPAGGTPEGTTQQAGQTPQPTARTTQSVAPTSFDAQVSALSAPSGGGSFVSGSGVGGGISGAGAGSMGGPAFRGEGMSDQQVQAQAKAMQLARAQVDQGGVGIAPIGEQVDLAGLQALRDKTRSMLDQYGPEAATMPEFKANIQAMLAAGMQNMQAIQQIPPVPVVETPAQEEFVTQVEDVFQQQDIRSFMDETRKALGMPELEKQRIGVMQQLNVVNETYQRVIDDIKANPNFPKGLAARRMTEIFQDQKFAANQLLSQLEVIDQQLEDGNSRLNQEMGIFEYEQSQSEKAFARRMDQFGYMVESGAVGGLDDKEMRQWASATGIPLSAVKKMRDNAMNPEASYGVEFREDGAGNLLMVTYDKNNPLNRQVDTLGRPAVSAGVSTGVAGGGQLSALAQAVLAGNQPIEKLSPKIRGEVTAELTAAGYSVTLPEFAAARAIIDQISAASQVVNRAESGLGRFAAGARNYYTGVVTQTFPEAQQLNQAVGKLSTIARTLGEKGVLTDQDIERVMKLIPSLWDSKTVAENKINDLTGLLNDIESRQQTVWVLPRAQEDEITLDDIFGQL